MVRGRVHELRYLVEIPIPYVDRRGRALDRRKRLRWQRRIEAVLTECFGGFTPAKAPAMNRVQTAGGSWRTLTERGQVVLRSACSDRDAFLAHRERLVNLVVRMGEDLAQADVFILAYDSDSMLIEVAEGHIEQKGSIDAEDQGARRGGGFGRGSPQEGSEGQGGRQALLP